MNSRPMSNIDKRALREAAEKASTDNHTQDEWFHYLRCLTPETALALLDELEAAEKRTAELEALTINPPEVRITVAESKQKNLTWRELGAYNEGADVAKEKILKVIRAAGIGKGE